MSETLFETYTVGFSDICLVIVYFLPIFFSICILINKNPVISVLFLIALFASVSAYLIMIGLYFIGLAYILVYIGAISILFLFILMLINIRVSELTAYNSNRMLLAVLCLVWFNYALKAMIEHKYSNSDFLHSLDQQTVDGVEFMALLQSSEVYDLINLNHDPCLNEAANSPHITCVGNILYTNLCILFIVSSFILLLSMIGAIIITISSYQSNSR